MHSAVHRHTHRNDDDDDDDDDEDDELQNAMCPDNSSSNLWYQGLSPFHDSSSLALLTLITCLNSPIIVVQKAFGSRDRSASQLSTGTVVPRVGRATKNIPVPVEAIISKSAV